MITVLVMIVIVAALISTASLIALGNRQRSVDSAATTKAQYAAEAGVELALKKIFHDPYDLWAASEDAKVKNADGQTVKFDSCAFKKWLTGLGNTATTTQLESNKAKDCPYVNFPTPATGAPFPNLISDSTQTISSEDADVPTNLKIAGTTYSVNVTRRDRTDGTVVLEMQSVGQVEQGGSIQAQRRLRRSVQIAADVFEGDKFGMLTSSTNCSFCHLQIDTMRRAYATDTSKKFERVKVGMLSVRDDATVTLGDSSHNGSDSIVFGSIYVRAPLTKVVAGATKTIINFGNTTASPYTTANTHYVLNSDGTVNVGNNKMILRLFLMQKLYQVQINHCIITTQIQRKCKRPHTMASGRISYYPIVSLHQSQTMKAIPTFLTQSGKTILIREHQEAKLFSKPVQSSSCTV
jgi:type II secretory pathway pseudopilin PulG